MTQLRRPGSSRVSPRLLQSIEDFDASLPTTELSELTFEDGLLHCGEDYHVGRLSVHEFRRFGEPHPTAPVRMKLQRYIAPPAPEKRLTTYNRWPWNDLEHRRSNEAILEAINEMREAYRRSVTQALPKGARIPDVELCGYAVAISERALELQGWAITAGANFIPDRLIRAALAEGLMVQARPSSGANPMYKAKR